MPVVVARMHGRGEYIGGDFDVLKACEIVRRGLCWGHGANH